MTFMNKLKAKKRRKRLNQKKEKQQLRGSNYSDKMKAKVYYIIHNNDCIVGQKKTRKNKTKKMD